MSNADGMRYVQYLGTEGAIISHNKTKANKLMKNEMGTMSRKDGEVEYKGAASDFTSLRYRTEYHQERTLHDWAYHEHKRRRDPFL